MKQKKNPTTPACSGLVTLCIAVFLNSHTNKEGRFILERGLEKVDPLSSHSRQAILEEVY